ncbi:unnamed protein product, partial [Penicillium nalgiovense]
ISRLAGPRPPPPCLIYPGFHRAPVRKSPSFFFFFFLFFFFFWFSFHSLLSVSCQEYSLSSLALTSMRARRWFLSLFSLLVCQFLMLAYRSCFWMVTPPLSWFIVF